MPKKTIAWTTRSISATRLCNDIEIVVSIPKSWGIFG